MRRDVFSFCVRAWFYLQIITSYSRGLDEGCSLETLLHVALQPFSQNCVTGPLLRSSFSEESEETA